jgi:large subunit ribosomal protein L30
MPKTAKKDASEATPKVNTVEQVRVTLVRSLLGRPEKQIRVIRALGLRKTNDVVVKFNTPTIRGMIQKVIHLLQVEVVTV